MKKKVVVIPKNKKPLEALLGMKEQLKKSWIFVHENVYRSLSKTCDSYTRHNSVNDLENAYMKWNAKKDKSEVVILLEIPQNTWGRIRTISAGSKNSFTTPKDPKYIYFIKIEE